MTRLLTTGARVTSVDEEGEVTLFCYTLGRSFAFRAGDPKVWGGMLGDFLTITITGEKLAEEKK